MKYEIVIIVLDMIAPRIIKYSNVAYLPRDCKTNNYFTLKSEAMLTKMTTINRFCNARTRAPLQSDRETPATTQCADSIEIFV